jgi:hypothetical protein
MLAWVVIYRRHLPHSTPISSPLRAAPAQTRSGRLCAQISSLPAPSGSLTTTVLSPLAAILTESTGWGQSSHFGSPRAHRGGTLRSPLSSTPFLSHSCALFCAREKLNPFLFKRFRTLCKEPPGWGWAHSSRSLPATRSLSTFNFRLSTSFSAPFFHRSRVTGPCS